MDKIKILLCTDSAGLPSGLAETTRNIFIPLLQKYPNKYHLEQLGFFHFLAKDPVPWQIHATKLMQTPQGLQPDMNDKYGEISFNEIVRKVQPHIVMGYGDMWHFNHLIASPFRNTYRLLTYYTIDGQPYFGHIHQDNSTDWGKQLTKVDQLVVLSHYGRDVLKRSCKELVDKEILVRYHPLNMSKFPARTPEQKMELRSSIMPPIVAKDSFVMGWMGRNQFRKQNYKLWEFLHYMVFGDYIECRACNRITLKEWDHSARATRDSSELTLYDKGYSYDYCWHCLSKNVIAGQPNDKFYLWLHMPRNDPGYNIELHERIWNVGNRCLYTNAIDANRGISREDVNGILASWDAMYYPSGGEGFSNPCFEAMAAGIPIVFSDYSSHAEFSRFGGLPVRVANYTPEIHHGINRAAVDTNHAIEQTLKLIRNQGLARQLGDRGRLYASQYDVGHMVDTWDHIFTKMMEKPLPMAGNVMYSTSI